MFETNVTVVGTVITAPEWRRTSKTNSLVAKFKVASTARRLDRENGRWVDGNSLRVRVNCWRKLAEGVAASVMVGDPVVVVGRLYTRDWTDGEGNHRTLYEMEAVAVGHDLARGRGRFVRNKPALATSTVEDQEAEARVRGEHTEPVPAEDAPVRSGEVFVDADPDFFDGLILDGSVPPESGTDELTTLRGGGFRPMDYADPAEGGDYRPGGPTGAASAAPAPSGAAGAQGRQGLDADLVDVDAGSGMGSGFAGMADPDMGDEEATRATVPA